MSAKDSLIFNAGVPTAPDVTRLEEAFPDLPDGKLIQWDEMETVLHFTKTDSRFRTVVGAWRKKLERERNIILGAVAGVGLEVLTREQRCEVGGSKLKRGIRSVKRGGAVILKTDRTGLPDEVCRAADHVVRLSAMITQTAATEAKKLRYPDPVLKLNK